MRAILAALFAALVTVACGVGAGVGPQTTVTSSANDATTVHVTRECRVTMHADKGLSPEARAAVKAAGDVWRGPTIGRVDIRATYDLEADSVEDLEEHVRAGDSLLLLTTEASELVARLDERHGHPVAVTFDAGNGAKHVLLIVERIPRDKAVSYIAHEFGHVCELPDLPVLGAIMSGSSIPAAPEPEGLTAEDMALCRAAYYCE